MSHLVAPFEVASRVLSHPVKCHFVRLMPGIATRHSDTMDVFFLAEGQKATVAISCATLTELREKEVKYLTDQQLVEIAALHLRRTLEQGYDATQAELFLAGDHFRALGRELGFL